tara:strand:+ start:144 stop:449 length:306 start_codon:yes stop_codon:yes gene_type:complete
VRLGQVIGRVVLNQKDPAFVGDRWLVVSPLSKGQMHTGEMLPLSDSPSVVVYDDLGAGVNDVIGYIEGAEATAPFKKPTPIDSYNAAIIDTINYKGSSIKL